MWAVDTIQSISVSDLVTFSSVLADCDPLHLSSHSKCLICPFWATVETRWLCPDDNPRFEIYTGRFLHEGEVCFQGILPERSSCPV